MITLPPRIERPLLDALVRFNPRPTMENAFECVRVKEVQDIAIDISRRMGTIAKEEDERRKNGNGIRISHRGFIVTGFTVCLTQPWPGSLVHGWAVIPACNSKPYKNSSKFCAEMRGMRAGLRRGYHCFCFFATVGEPQADGGSGVESETLHMCEGCRAMARSGKYRHMFLDETVSLTAPPDGDVRELHTMPELMAIHGEPW